MIVILSDQIDVDATKAVQFDDLVLYQGISGIPTTSLVAEKMRVVSLRLSLRWPILVASRTIAQTKNIFEDTS